MTTSTKINTTTQNKLLDKNTHWKTIFITTHRHYSPQKNTPLNETPSPHHQSWATSDKLLFERSFSFHHLSTSDPPKEHLKSPKPNFSLRTNSRSRIKSDRPTRLQNQIRSVSLAPGPLEKHQSHPDKITDRHQLPISKQK